MGDVKLLPLPAWDVAYTVSYSGASMRDYARACVEANTEALRAEVERLQQLVNGGRGPLPADAVAWLDMSPGEASLAFDKKSDSNRANKRRLMELFHRVSAGYYPLYLEPQADRAERLAEALREAREYVTTALREEREKFAGHEDCSDIPGIEADLHKIDTALNSAAAQKEDHD